MRKFGLIGYPLGHSFSKKYFTEKFAREHIEDCSYELYPIADINQLQSLINEEINLAGLNVTIPYKSAVISFLDSLSDEAREINAVNVIKIRREGEDIFLTGFNSDISGFRESLLQLLGCRRGNAIVLGTGGSSKAVCRVLEKIGMNVINVSRNPGTRLITYKDLDREIIRGSALIINTTPLGMLPDIDSKPPVDYDSLTKDQILYDLVYNPERTAFLIEGEKRGCTVINGMEMLRIQAEKSWEIWNDESL